MDNGQTQNEKQNPESAKGGRFQKRISVLNLIRTKKVILYASLVVCIGILFYFLCVNVPAILVKVKEILGIMRPFFFGVIICYLLRPVAKAIERFALKVLSKIDQKKQHPVIARAFSVTIALLFGLAIVTVLIMLIVPQVVDSVIQLSKTLPPQIDAWVKHLEQRIEENPDIVAQIESVYQSMSESIRNFVGNKLLPNLQTYAVQIGGGAYSAIRVLLDIIIGLVVAVYLLADRERFKALAKRFLKLILKPNAYRAVSNELRFADQSFNGFINGKILDSAIVGIVCYIFCLIMKMPNSILVAVIIGVTNIIPFFGPFIGAIPMFLLIAVSSPIKALWFLVFIVVLQQIDGNILGPKILGNTTGISAFWVLFSITLFGGLWGVPGMIIAIPLFAVIRDILGKIVKRREEKRAKEEAEASGQPEGEPVPAAEPESEDAPNA